MSARAVFLSLLGALWLNAPSVFAAETPDFSSSITLGELWYKEEVYFRPTHQAPAGETTWNGQIYHYPSQKCFELTQPELTDKVGYRAITCETAMVAKATEPYTKVADFARFKTVFLQCVDKRDKKCLRGYIARTLQISLGPDGYDDRRDIIFEEWTDKDYAGLAAAIRKGVYRAGEQMRFPPKAGAGMRGSFRMRDGGWQLISYFGGD